MSLIDVMYMVHSAAGMREVVSRESASVQEPPQRLQLDGAGSQSGGGGVQDPGGQAESPDQGPQQAGEHRKTSASRSHSTFIGLSHRGRVRPAHLRTVKLWSKSDNLRLRELDSQSGRSVRRSSAQIVPDRWHRLICALECAGDADV